MKGDARLSGRRVRIRALEPSDYQGLRRIELSPHLAFRWRHHGIHQSPEEFAISVWADTLCNFIIEDLRSGHAIGLVSTYNANLSAGTAYIAAAKFNSSTEFGSRTVAGLALAIDYAFSGWPIRKLYLESPSYNVEQFDRLIGRLLKEEGRLKEHVYLDGAYHDLIVLALWRDDWTAERERFLKLA